MPVAARRGTGPARKTIGSHDAVAEGPVMNGRGARHKRASGRHRA